MRRTHTIDTPTVDEAIPQDDLHDAHHRERPQNANCKVVENQPESQAHRRV